MIKDQLESDLLALPALLSNPFTDPIVSTIEEGVTRISEHYRIVRFNDQLLVEVTEPYCHFKPISKAELYQLSQPLLPSSFSKAKINDVVACLSSRAQDLSVNENYILFGNLTDPNSNLLIWDMELLKFTDVVLPRDCVWRSPYSISLEETDNTDAVMYFAGGNIELYDDIIQSLAPLVMAKKPDGVIWWTGENSTGKDLLITTLHQIFPDQLSNISLRRLTGGRETKCLNGVLGNIVNENSELRLEDNQTSKQIGSHRDYTIHKYHYQTGLKINGNIHHIFSATYTSDVSNRRWGKSGTTYVIPFEKTLFRINDNQLERLAECLITDILRYSSRIKTLGYRYEWSSSTKLLNPDS